MHKVQITPSAGDDLLEVFSFYEAREAGVGDYFLQCLALALTRWACTVVFIPSRILVCTVHRPNDFRFLSTTHLMD
jgi:hypothetical protein